MALGVADGRIFVICTGDGLRSFHIDADGKATQLSDEPISCVLKSAADTAQAIRPEPRAGRLLFVAAAPRLTGLSIANHQSRGPPTRAPPLI